ncbi:MAG: DNA mismatch repair protein MutS, partial [Rhodospirillales bacterium]|nr:DNA mismatch repair protein MutS [Rhodospirillales bacterium]
MMAQYLAIKRDNPGCLLFYRMGDFYELFFDDAVEAAAALDIALTKRGRHLGGDIPMCGVPVHSHETYLQRLIRKGFKVAICEQVEDPAEAKKRGAKAVVERAVVRTITAGTLTEDTLLDAKRNNFIAALAEVQGSFGLAWLDMSTGDFRLQTAGALGSALARLGPGEVVIPDRIFGREDVADDLDPWRDVMTPLPASRFDSAGGERRLKALFGVQALDAFGAFSRAELAAGGALIDYVELTQQGRLPRIARPRRLSEGAVLEIDAATRRNLELAQTMAGERAGSLLGVMDRTQTGAGGRLLAAQLAAPLTDLDRINGRLDRVQHFHDDHGLRAGVRERLAQCPDLERALSRISVGRGGPRDLAAVRDGLELAGALRETLEAGAMPASLSGPVSDLGAHGELVDHLRRALADELPISTKDGGFIAPGFAPAFDELKGLRDESRKMIAGLQDKYVRETGIANLKIKHNNVLGYFVEVTARNADAMPASGEGGEDSPFIHRQTMANAVRYSTVELSDLEGRIASAADKALALELELFAGLTGRVMANADDIALAARALATIDVASSLAELAVDRRYQRPRVDGSRDFEITGGRHPVVEQALVRSGGSAFVANGCALSGADRIWLLTGPNMA